MKRKLCLLIITVCLTAMAVLGGCKNNTKEISKKLDIEQAEKTYLHYAPAIKEDVKSVTDADVLEMCLIDREETDLFNENYTDGKTKAEKYNPTEEMFKYLPDNTESCYVERWLKEDESENYVHLEYIDDQQIQVGITYDSQGMRDIYIYFRNENRYVSISDELAFEVLNFGGKKTEDSSVNERLYS